MKRTILVASTLFLAVGFIFLNGCKKDDTTAPTISITGDNPKTIGLNSVSSYSDPGATASDEEDGSVLSGFSGTAFTCQATVSGQAITIPTQTVSPFTIHGTGTINNKANQIILDYNSSGGPDPGDFHAVLTKI